jgi:hypothetical protein
VQVLQTFDAHIETRRMYVCNYLFHGSVFAELTAESLTVQAPVLKPLTDEVPCVCAGEETDAGEFEMSRGGYSLLLLNNPF